MSLLSIVGPAGVGKSFLSQRIRDKIGDNFATIVQAPPAYDNPALEPMTWDDAYFWGFEAIRQIADGNPNHLFILDGFPHPDHWALTNERWGMLHQNMEQRMRTLGAHQLVILPSRWKEWEGRAVHEYMINSAKASRVRARYDELKQRTTLVTAIVPASEVNVNKVDKLLKGLGVEV